jgi:class 3 adenylate cyclase/tetratricopeptide (TPR) repeat protein
MTCPSCGTLNEAGRKFCGECGTKLAAVCPSCGSANAPSARFCGECGNALSSGTPAAASQAPAGPPANPGPVAERRLVTVLFADLVGFTTLSEGRDPEAVRELLTAYFDLATDVIRRYGGTVEKFIGDAVMAVWGAPTAHEDDAERAVRAGLDLIDAVQSLGPGIRARGGVLTGEAAVTLGATDQGMVAGDLVNTASRLQSVAPAGTVLVGEPTLRATNNAIAYEEAGEQLLKGKTAPVPAWRAIRVVAERGGRGRDDRLEAPFVGRDTELRLLKDLFHATSRERRVRLVSITGQGGIGKSRLAWEFQKYLDGLVERIWWHDGRSPAYGEGITFWALGEMVRSRAGLLETDDPVKTRAGIADMLTRYDFAEDDRRRIEPALLALLGAGDAPAGGPDELFSAWRTFFEGLAAQSLVVLLFEDLHWADPGTLDFIEHLLEWTRNAPILIVTLARPELLEHRPGWGAGRRAFLALDLQPMDDASMRQLLTGLVTGLPEPAIRSIVARAEGIPLYAVETIRMLVADGRLREREAGTGYEPTGELGELAVPDTLHALIAARLDGLESAERALVQDAAALGQSFTVDGVAAVAGLDPSVARPRLDRLVRAELLRQEIDPRSPERGQYAFVQALIREVAYSTLSLRDRRARHLAAARYFESVGDEELAGALAAHYLAAYRASNDGPEADALVAQARISLRAAADRANALGAPGQAVTFLERAIEVTGDPADRADLHEQAGLAAMRAAKAEAALVHFEAASALVTETGDRSAQARLAAREGAALGALRRRDEAQVRLEAAWARVADLGDDDPGVVLVAERLASNALNLGDYEQATLMADRALASAERLGLAENAAEAINTLGTAAFYRGRQWQARALLEGARHLATEANIYNSLFRSLVMLPSFIALDDPRGAVTLEREGIALARRVGNRAGELGILFNASEDARRTGDWEWAITEMAAVEQLDVDESTLVGNRAQQSFFEIYRGTFDPATLDELDRRIQSLEDRDLHAGLFDIRAAYAYSEGRYAEAAEAWMQVGGISDLNAPYALPRAGRAAILAGRSEIADAALATLQRLGTRGRAMDADRAAIRAGLAALSGDRAAARVHYRTALTAFRDLGLPWDEALAGVEAAGRLGAGDAELAAWTETSRATFERLGAAPMIARLDEAIAQGDAAAAASSSAADRSTPDVSSVPIAD